MQDPCAEPVVVVGDGPLAAECATSIAERFPDRPLLLVLPAPLYPSLFSNEGPRAAPAEPKHATGSGASGSGGSGGGIGGSGIGGGGIGGGGAGNPSDGVGAELSALYEAQLAKLGVKLARGFTPKRLWLTTETVRF